MSKPTDFYDDVNQQQLYSLERLCGLPDFVKTAEMETTEHTKTIPETSFGDPRHRKFPCHTKAATFLANAYFQQSKPLYSKNDAAFVQERIVKFAEFWKIKTLVDDFNTKWTKIASVGAPDMTDNDFALVYEADGNKVRRMPMPNAVSVKMAGEYLFSNRHMYTYPMRKLAARRILKKALEYDERASKGEKIAGAEVGTLHFETETQEYLERAAGFGATHPLWAAEKIAQRVIMLSPKHQDMKVKLAEISEHLKGLHEAKPAFFQKLAEVVDTVDREAGLCNYYQSGVEMPEEMFFQVLEKEAEDVLHNFVTLQTGKSYPIGAFLDLPLEKISAVMGKDFMDAVVSDDKINIDPYKFASIAPTLPRGDAALLERAMFEARNAPLDKEARRRYGTHNAKYTKQGMIDFFQSQGKDVEDASDYRLAIKPGKPTEKDAGLGDIAGRAASGAAGAVGGAVGGGLEAAGNGIVGMANSLKPGMGRQLLHAMQDPKTLGSLRAKLLRKRSYQTLGAGAVGLGGGLAATAASGNDSGELNPR